MAKKKAAKKSVRKTRRRTEPTSLRLLKKLYEKRRIIGLSIAIILAFIGTYIRMLPALRYGYELYANDPWIMYWMTKYLVKHGILSWFTLTPQNPATHIFWYPWGRNFVHDEYPLSSMFAALTYPIGHALGFSVKKWCVIEPPLFGFAMVITAYLLARELGGELAGVIAALFVAVTPGAIQRTIAGFIEKEGLAMPILLLSLLFAVKFLKKKSLAYAITSGVLAGLVAWTWGGYQALCILLAIIFALYPLAGVIDRRVMAGSIALLLVDFAISISCPAVDAATFLTGAGLVMLAGIAAMGLALIFKKLEDRGVRILKLSYKLSYLGILVLAGAVGFVLVYSGKLSFSSRVLAFLGRHFTSPLVASVAEHQWLPSSAVFRSVGGPFILAIVYLAYAFYKLRREPWHIVLIPPTILTLYSAFAAAYLMQFVATILCVAAGVALTPLARLFYKNVISSGGRSVDSLTLSGVVVGVLVVVLIALAHAKVAVAQAESDIPTIKAGGLDLTIENNAWVYALNFLKNDTPPNSVVIAWWDYGYWISVWAHRATVADGATCNSTQIKLLAKALTAQNESEAVNIIFKDFKAPKNATYLVIFDVFRSVPASGKTRVWLTGPIISPYTHTAGMGDIPKSIWMLRIGGRIGLHEYKPYFTVRFISFMGRKVPISTPDWENPIVQRTLIYKLFIDGVDTLNKTVIGNYDELANATHVFTDWTSLATGKLTTIGYIPLKHFIPYKTAVDMIYNAPNEKVFVAVFIFKVVP